MSLPTLTIWCTADILLRAVRRGSLFLLCATTLVAAQTRTACAQGIQLLLPQDRTIRVHGKVGDEAAFTADLTIAAPAAVPTVVFRASDLRRNDGPEVIRGSSVTIVGPLPVSLAPNVPRDLDVKVGGIKRPGTYAGTLFFMLPTELPAQALQVPIEVTATAVPVLTQRKGSESIKIQLVRCSRLGCAVAKLLQPDAFRDSYPLPLDNPSLEPFEISASLSAIGEIHRAAIDPALNVPAGQTVNPSPVFTLPIVVRPGEPKPLPDHYVGDVQIRIQGADAPMRIPLEVNVRSGAFLPMVVILVGILLGRAVKYMKDRGGPQSDLLFKFYRFEGEVSRVPAHRQLLAPMLESVRAAIYAMDLQTASAALDALDARWKLLLRLSAAATQLDGRREPEVAVIRDDIARAQRLIAAASDADAAALVGQIEGRVQALAAPPAGAAFDLGAPAPATATTRVQTTVARTERTRSVARIVSVLTGMSDEFRAELTLWTLRPLLYVLLLGALVVVGVLQLYLKNPTFGSDPVTDYFGLFVWGLSSDVASRTLAALKP